MLVLLTEIYAQRLDFVTSVGKAKAEVHTRIESLDAFNERAWSHTVDGIKEEALANKRHILDLFEHVKSIKKKQVVVDKVVTKTTLDLAEASDRIESLEVEARILHESLLNSQVLLARAQHHGKACTTW